VKIYLDTNIFDLLTKDDHRKKDTEILFSKIENGKFEAYYSPTVVEEILRTKCKRQRGRLEKILTEKMLKKRCVKPIYLNIDDLFKIHKLVDAYYYDSEERISTSSGFRIIRRKSIFSKSGSQAGDRIQVATAVINKIDAFVTWNTREFIKTKKITSLINSVNEKLGYTKIDFFNPTRLIRELNLLYC